MHDIGHGPFSHAMEHIIVEEVNHESISLLFMNQLNEECGGQLQLAMFAKEFIALSALFWVERKQTAHDTNNFFD